MSSYKKILMVLLTVLFSIDALEAFTEYDEDVGAARSEVRRGRLVGTERGKNGKSKGYVADELLVRFSPKSKGKQRAKAEKNDILASIGAGNIKRSYHLVPGLTVVKLPGGLSVENALKRFKGKGEILYAEPNYELYALAIPNDPNFSDQWGMHNTGQTGGTSDADIDAPEAWDIENDANEIIVAVIDTGVDYNHPDLVANMWTDANGCYGYDYVNDDNDPMDDHFHGTHCAGIIGAVGNNNTGVTGVCWDVQIMAIKFLNSAGYGDTGVAISCIEYAVDNGADILSNSWGGGGANEALEDAIEAAGANGVLFIAAAGNELTDNDGFWPHYPSSYDCNNIISVLSMNKYDHLSWFSNWGLESIDIGAPGSNILSTFPTYETSAMASYGFSTNYETIGGTSMATPHVAGACALIWSKYPSLSYSEVIELLFETVDPVLPETCVSEGRMNLYWAIVNKSVMNTTQMNGYDTIQSAIDDANNGDIIRVRPGTYYENVDFDGVNVTLSSINPADPCVVAATIIDANGGTGVTFNSSEDANSILTGFTITGGTYSGIYCNGSSPSISNCVITDNSCNTWGGGMFIINNSSPTITDCAIKNNSASRGGGMLNGGYNTTLINCVFSDNSASDAGGAILNYTNSNNVTATGCLFNGNTAAGGGGIYSYQTDLTLTNCTFYGNVGTASGGAMWSHNSDLDVKNCLFYDNSSGSYGGGALYHDAVTSIFSNCTFSQNTTTGNGGAMWNTSTNDQTIVNCIFWDNSASGSGDEVYNVSVSAEPNFSYCDIENCGGSGGGWDPNIGTDDGGNIDVNPNFVNPNDPNGTDDLFMTSDDGLVLDSGSPCIDAGDNDAASVAGDIASNLRRRDDSGTSDTGNGTSPIVDIGAYEYVGDSLTMYVDVDVSGSTNNGQSWSTAFDNIQEALDYSIDGDEIRVAEGTYSPDATIDVNTAVDIYGGYDASTGLRDWQSNTTTIDGADTIRCFYVDANALIDGFTITNGNASPRLPDAGAIGSRIDGGGMYVPYYVEPSVANCTFSDCNALFSYGGGLCVRAWYNAIDVSNCTFTDNSAYYGGGFYSYRCDVNATDCNFTGNSASFKGGGAYAYAYNASPVFERCTFSQNSAIKNSISTNGAGLYIMSGTPEVKYCDFSYNHSAWSGGGIFFYNNNYTVNGCNFEHNTAGKYGGGIGEYSGSSSGIILDCNFYDNSVSINGGAIMLEQSNVDVEDCNFTGNSASSWGGAIFHRYPTMPGNIRYCNFIDNDASWGGAVCGENSDMDIEYCVFTDNTASKGGAVNNYEYSSPTIRNSTFSDNSVNGDGGALYNGRYTDPEIKYNVFTGNSAGDEGGAIYNDHTSLPLIRDSEFMLNTAGTDGGAMYFWHDSYPTIDDCWFEKNAADGDAGAIFFGLECYPLITSCVFWDNNSVDDGGAIYNENCSLESYLPEIFNCTFFENEAGDDGGAIYNDDSDPDITNCILWNDVAGGSGDEIYDAGTSDSDVDDCLEDEDPDFVDESDPRGSDGEWGTSDDGLCVESGSDAIDEGRNSAGEDDYDEEDITGEDRIIDGDEDDDDDVDIGAYEYVP